MYQNTSFTPGESRLVIAARIYLVDDIPMADLRLADGSVVTIEWCKSDERYAYWNGYTLFYDERPKRSWQDWIIEED